MKSWVKALLVALVVLTLTGVMGAVGFKYWWEANRGRLKEMGERASREGKAFGENSDAEGCMQETLARLDAKGGFIGHVANKMFLKACLTIAKRPAAFCNAVPGPEQPYKSATWVFDECKRRKHSDSQFCPAVMQAVVEVCRPDENK